MFETNLQSSKKIKAVIYARVSTTLQEFPKTQIEACTQLSEARGFELSATYTDYGVSGRKEKRPALDQMLNDARKGKFKIILVSALDRVGRNTRHLLNLFNELNDYGVKIISLRENLDLTTPIGNAMIVIIAAISELEVNLTRERIKTALAIKKATALKDKSDWRCGRPPINQGIKSKALELILQGRSYSQIGKELSISKASVCRILKTAKS